MLPFIAIREVVVVVLMLIVLTVPFSHCSSNPDYSLCSSPYSCGRIKDARFPFCGDKRPSFCGLHDFRLKCTNNNSEYPWILVNSGHYNVYQIDPSFHNITVSRGKIDTCNLLVKDQTLIDVVAPFELGANVGRLALFYGCPNDTLSEFQHLSIECPTFGLNASVYYFFKTSYGRSCKTSVKLPVFKGVLDELYHGNTTLENALEKEFELGYTADFSACTKCQKSGGLCGSSFSNATEFVCHKSDKRHGHISLGLGITGVTMSVLIAIFVACWYYKRLDSRSVSRELTAEDLKMSSICFGVPLFSYKELKEATNNFDESSQLGHGGFGIVFYGKLKDGREVAVKRLYEKSYKIVEQFMNEVQILTCLRHQNLVSLYGSTSPRCKELLLVYEYIPNGTVADHLHGKKVNSEFLSWSIRLRIAIETATALTSLHASDIIHRDIKTNNILLDRNFSVKVADFGLSRLFPVDVTHVSTAPQGSPGYLDPEYNNCYQLTVKSDVYSFGVVLVELISSLPAVDMNRLKYEINLSNYAMKKIQQGLLHELVDPRLGFGSDLRVKKMITCMAELAFRCLQHDKEFRPSMDEVLGVLNRIKNGEYETLDGKEEPKRDGIGGSAKTPASPTEDDYAGLLISSRSSAPSNSSG